MLNEKRESGKEIIEADFTVGCFGGQRKSRKGEDLITAGTTASTKEFRVTAYTFPKYVVDPLAKQCAGIRQHFKNQGLNGRNGAIYVTRERYAQVEQEIRDKWQAIVDSVNATWTEERYTKLIDEQKTNLSGLFDETKIASREAIIKSYDMELFPRKVSLDSFTSDPIDKAQLDGYKDRIEEGLSCLVDVLRGFTERVINNMNDDDAHYKCAFDTCKKITVTARNMNIFKDVLIENVINKVEQIFGSYSPEDFKKDAGARDSVAENANKILGEIDNIVVENEMENLFGDAISEAQ